MSEKWIVYDCGEGTKTGNRWLLIEEDGTIDGRVEASFSNEEIADVSCAALNGREKATVSESDSEE